MALRNALHFTHRAFATYGSLALGKAWPCHRAPGLGAWQLQVVLSVGVVGAAFIGALDIASRLAQTSDSAQGFVEGYAIARGNILLSGWHLPLDNYYFTDTLSYAALEWIAGPRPFLLALVPAITYALFVCAGLAVCLKPAQSATRNIEAASAAALMLAPSGWIGSWNPLLMSNMHFATVLGALIALALLARIARSERDGLAFTRWCWVFAAVAAVTIASDPFSLFFAFGPALILLSVDALRRGLKFTEGVALFVLAGAIIAGAILPFVMAVSGGFATENNLVLGSVSAALAWRNVIALGGGLLRLSAIDWLGSDFSLLGVGFLALRVGVFIVAVAAVFRAARGLLRPDPACLLDRLLCAGVLSLVAACVLSAQFGRGIDTQNPWAGGPPMRYAMPAVLFGAILGARRIPGMLSSLRGARVSLAARGALALLAVLALSAGPSEAPDQPRWISLSPPATAAYWLLQHRLTAGDADYWSANLVAAMSGQALDLRGVVPRDGKVVPYSLSADTRGHRPPQFMIWQDGTRSGMTFADIRATYRICRLVMVAGFRIALLARGERNPACL